MAVESETLLKKLLTAANCVKSLSPIRRFRILGQTCSNSGHRPRTPVKFSDVPIHMIHTGSVSHKFGLSDSGYRKSSSVAAFTLVEAMIASGVMVLFVAGCLTSIIVSQVSTRKSKEEAIAMDFLTKYAETIKALPFTSLVAGQHINSSYDGLTHNGVLFPLINLPASGALVSVNTANYQLFYPDLLWFSNRNPQMVVTMTQNIVGGKLHDIEVNIKIDWDPPLAKGARQEVEVDFLRTKDVPTL
jgi:hypothetical protein